VEGFLEALVAFEGAVIIVTHVERVLSALATRLVVFDGGKVELFHGGYADFLERVGWRAEREENSTEGARERQTNRREDRRQRAEIVERRSKELGRLREAIGAIESEIMALEDRLARDDAALVDASIRNQGAVVRTLSAATSAARKRIESLFDEMAALGVELHEKERAFEAEWKSGAR